MYLRETKRRRRDGSEMSYLALAHNERDPDTGTPRARVLYNFRRADRVDRAAPERLMDSVGRFLHPEGNEDAAEGDDVAARSGGTLPSVADSRPMGTSWMADQLWQRLGIAAAIRGCAEQRRVDGEMAKLVLFAMVANRLSAQPLSKHAGCKWVAERVFIDGLAEVTEPLGPLSAKPHVTPISALPSAHQLRKSGGKSFGKWNGFTAVGWL
jgi:hypothetical protein